MLKRCFEIFTLMVLILFFMVASVFAFPNFINYQGKLTDSSGNLLNGEYLLTFKIYSVETWGSSLWTEEQLVMVTNGIYNAKLGAVNPFPANLFETESLYLEVIILNTDTGMDETLSPRIPFTSTGFSMKAKDVDSVAWSNIIGKPAGFADDEDDFIDADADPGNEIQTLGTSGNKITLSKSSGSITAPYATNADKVDGKHASSFTTPSTDAGRYNVVPDLFEGIQTLSTRYVNEGQANSISSNMIKTGAVVSSDIADGSIQKDDLSNSAKCSLDASDGSPVNQVYVNSSGNVGIGSTNPKGKLDVNGNIRINGEYPFIFQRYSNLGDNVDHPTCYSTKYYAAAIVGFFIYNGDINENDAGDIINLRMIPSQGIWRIRADFRTHNNHESWYVDVMYVKRELVQMIGYGI